MYSAQWEDHGRKKCSAQLIILLLLLALFQTIKCWRRMDRGDACVCRPKHGVHDDMRDDFWYFHHLNSLLRKSKPMSEPSSMHFRPTFCCSFNRSDIKSIVACDAYEPAVLSSHLNMNCTITNIDK